MDHAQNLGYSSIARIRVPLNKIGKKFVVPSEDSSGCT